MLLYQFGGMRGVQEISGLIILSCPITLVGVGVIKIIILEIYEFFTWYTIGITKDINLYNSVNLVFPEFYIGLLISVIMVFIYFFIDKIIKE